MADVAQATKERMAYEDALIGLVLKYPDGFGELLLTPLEAKHFVKPLYRDVFGRFKTAYMADHAYPSVNMLIDLVPGDQRKKVERELLSAKERVDEPWSNAKVYAKKIVQKYVSGEFLKLAGDILEKVEAKADPDEIREAILSSTLDLQTPSSELRAPVEIHKGLSDLVLDWEQAGSGIQIEKQSVIPSGYEDLDRPLQGGFRTGTVSLVCARPGHGKSTLLQNFCLQAALYYNKPVAWITLEMTPRQSLMRFLSSLTVKVNDGGFQVPLSAMRTPRGMTPKLLERFREIVTTIDGLPIYVVEGSGMTGNEFYAMSRFMKEQYGIEAFYVDYFGLFKLDGGRIPEKQSEFGGLSESIRLSARNNNVAIIMATQLNRDIEKRAKEDQKPRLSDLRDTGKLEQDAEVVLGIYRDEVVNKGESNRPGEMDVEVLKNRDGELGTTTLQFVKEYMSIEDVGAGIASAGN